MDRLSEEVDDLAEENDRYAFLNSQLNQTAQDYRVLNADLNASTSRLETLNEQLNQSNAVFLELNNQLSNQNGIYADMNAQLNDTVEDLQLIAGFLNSTAVHLQQSFESISDYLAEQISVNRMLVLQTLKNTFQQRLQSLECAYLSYFRSEAFVLDSNNAVNATTLSLVLDYIQDQLLNDLCLSYEDFESYLRSNYGHDGEITSNEILQGAFRYGTLALRFYFPGTSSATAENSNQGVSSDEWAAAFYQCTNLKQLFTW